MAQSLLLLMPSPFGRMMHTTQAQHGHPRLDAKPQPAQRRAVGSRSVHMTGLPSWAAVSLPSAASPGRTYISIG